MEKAAYLEIRDYMRACAAGCAHDETHALRVLFDALDIAQAEKDVNYDVLIAACLLHDIGRDEERRDPAQHHAETGARKAREFLLANGYTEAFAARVAACVAAHSAGGTVERPRVEMRILHDAEQLDALGALGTARALLGHGAQGEGLYALDDDGMPLDGRGGDGNYFAQYQTRLRALPARMLTARGRLLARHRARAAENMYNMCLAEAQLCHENGKNFLLRHIDRPSTQKNF